MASKKVLVFERSLKGSKRILRRTERLKDTKAEGLTPLRVFNRPLSKSERPLNGSQKPLMLWV